MNIYDEPLTDEAVAMLLQIEQESKGMPPVKQEGRNSDVWGPVMPGFEYLSEKRKQEFTQYLIDCYPAITEEQIAKVNKEMMVEIHDHWGITDLSRAIPIALESERRRGRLSSIPFYANRAEKDGIGYWVRMCVSYRGTD